MCAWLGNNLIKYNFGGVFKLFDSTKLQYYRARLLQMKEQLNKNNRGIRDTGLGESLQESVGELSLYDNHPGDIASEVFERSKDLSLQDNNRIQMQKVKDALKKIDEGTYGFCDECGQPIDKDRLEVIPETTKCIHCRKLQYETGDNNIRPIEEKTVPAHLRKKQVMDQEDSWQDVARWNEHANGAGAGSYYGGTDLDEDRSVTEMVEGIPYFRGKDGVIYEDVYGHDDESAPREEIIGENEENEVH